jgi:hypothetical protein
LPKGGCLVVLHNLVFDAVEIAKVEPLAWFIILMTVRAEAMCPSGCFNGIQIIDNNCQMVETAKLAVAVRAWG